MEDFTPAECSVLVAWGLVILLGGAVAGWRGAMIACAAYFFGCVMGERTR